MSGWTWQERKEHREREKFSDWLPIGSDDPNFKRIWCADAGARAPDAEGLGRAWLRIYGETFNPQAAIATVDPDDEPAYLFSFNRVCVRAYDGDSIWQYLPERKFDDDDLPRGPALQRRWFSYTPDYGCEFHDSPQAAKAQSEVALGDYRDIARDEGAWPEETEQVCWGEVVEQVREIGLGDGQAEFRLGLPIRSRP